MHTSGRGVRVWSSESYFLVVGEADACKEYDDS